MCKKTIRQLRLEKDITQEELAKRAELTLKTISNYELSPEKLRRASYSNLLKVASVLGVKVEQIFLG